MERKLFLSFVMTILILAVKDIACREFELGPCYLQFSETCSNNSIQFFLFSSEFPEDSPLKLDKVKARLPLGHEEILTKNFKLIIHGYGGHLDFKGSKNVRNGKTCTQEFIKSNHKKFANSLLLLILATFTTHSRSRLVSSAVSACTRSLEEKKAIKE